MIQVILMMFILASGLEAQVVNIAFRVTDGIVFDTLRIGVDPLATDSIDTQFGEAELPPLPPTGIFDARLVNGTLGINIGQGSKKDFRQGWPPYNIIRSYRVDLQKTYPDSVGKLIFSGFPDFPIGTTIVVRDLFGGIILNDTLYTPRTVSFRLAGINQVLIFLNLILLPVEMTSFTSAVIANDVRLMWTTATELNNSGFEVQRKSADSENWNVIGFVSGKINSNEPNEYTYDDRALAMGSYRYRLKQIDLNGNFEYFDLSESVNIGRPNSYQLYQNYPNPFNPDTRIVYQIPKTEFIKIVLYDNIGREVRTLYEGRQNAGYHDLKVNFDNLSSGMYYYTMTAGTFADTKKMVLMR